MDAKSWLFEMEGQIRRDLAKSASENKVLEPGQRVIFFMYIEDGSLVVRGEPEDVFSLSVEKLDLPVRARKACGRACHGGAYQPTTIGELIQKSAEELLDQKNCGYITLEEIRYQLLMKFGLKLKGD